MGSSTKRVLIYRLGSLGDTLIALPAFYLVARAFPNAERRLLTNYPVNAKAPPAASILENTGLVHSYIRYSVGTRSPRELLRLWSQLLRWRPEVLVYIGSARGVESARRDQTFFRLCGIRKLIGIPITEDMQQNRWQEPHQALEPEASRLARNLSELGDASLDAPASWDMHLTAAENARAREVLVPLAGYPILAISVGTKVQSKDWGRENWRALLNHLATQYPNFAVAFLGTQEESESTEFAAAGWRENSSTPIVNLCGRLNPRESAAVIAQARAFLGHDSGPMHLAAAVQTPCVAIFAARNKPRVWFPYGSQHRILYHQTNCWGCGLETCIVEKKKCLTSITVDEVITEVRALLG
jgi:ADP-heptose:LPS heptosyltransferase